MIAMPCGIPCRTGRGYGWQVLRFWLSSLLLQVREAVPIFIIVLTDRLVDEVESIGKLVGYIDSLPPQ